MKNIAYYNGVIGELSEMTVSMSDRVCYFGDGVYDATYARNNIVFTLDEHLERLFSSADKAEIVPSLSFVETKNLVNSLVNKASKDELFVYIQFTRGLTTPRNHLFDGSKSSVWVTVTPKEITRKDKKLKIVSILDKRFRFCDIKTVNLLPNVLASGEAAKQGCDEAVFVEQNGVVNECSHSNIHILKDNVLISAPPGEKVLGGIARKHLLRACKVYGIKTDERHFDLTEIMESDEVFITSAGTLLSPVEFLNGQRVGGRAPLTFLTLQNHLYEEFYNATNGQKLR